MKTQKSTGERQLLGVFCVTFVLLSAKAATLAPLALEFETTIQSVTQSVKTKQPDFGGRLLVAIPSHCLANLSSL